MENEKVKFENISAKAWEHPTDKAALAALEKIPGLDVLLKKVVGTTTEKSLRIATLASSVRTSERQFPKLYSLYKDACSILDMPYIPELFIAQSPFINAQAVGVNEPFIVLNSEVLEKHSDDEIMVILGHELGHCMSGHVLYKTLLHILISLPTAMLNIPMSGVIIMPIILALKEWDRKSELSADRAGQLVVQDSTASYSLLMKMAGGSQFSQMDINEFFKQATEYEELEGVTENVHKFLNLMMLSHPFPVLRLTQLKSWIDCGDYGKIISGDYPKRGEDDNIADHFTDAGKTYRDEMTGMKGPFGDMASSFFNAVDKVSDHTSDMRGRAINMWDKFFDDDKNTR